jgi:hypothetical protein
MDRSSLNAIMGSTRAARRAGMKLAAVATTSRKATVSTNVRASVGATP